MSKMERTTMAVSSDGIAVITIDHPPVNALSFDVFDSLKQNYEEAFSRDDVTAIVLVGARAKFSGGFDINGFKNPRSGGFRTMDIINDIVEDGKKPTVAAIDGLALGGGLELAMACHGRISTSTAQLGLPELQLGIIPGLGGTQRLPRLVGIAKALEIMLKSKFVKGEEARSLGLVDAVVSSDVLVKTACSWANDIAALRRPWIKSLYRTDKLEPLSEASEIFNFAKLQAKKEAANLEHPLFCIGAVEEGVLKGPRAGLLKETEYSKILTSSITSKCLMHVFFAQRATTKIPGVTDIGLSPRTIRRVAIIGGGLMGSGIATALLLSGYPVLLKEVNESLLQQGISRVQANLLSRVKKGIITGEGSKKVLSLMTGVLDYKQFDNVDLVIEAVVENISLKQQIFADLEKYCPRHCILASNTSTINLNLIGEKTRSQDRIVGAHFFSPAHVIPLLEIVDSGMTSPQIIVDLLAVGKKIQKTPIVVGNCTGFAVNRMFFPYTNTALFLVDHGLNLYRIDHAIRNFGMPMGPFRMVDLAGVGVAVASGMQYFKNFPGRCYRSLLLEIMLEDNRTGETSQKGFYVYGDNRKASEDPELEIYIEKSRSMAGIQQDPELMKLEDKDIVEMLFFPVVNEACRILDEGITSKASDLDIGSIMGMGFPSYRGGIMFWADTVGASYVYARLENWFKRFGDIFKPCSFLKERATRGIQLSAPHAKTKSQL